MTRALKSPRIWLWGVAAILAAAFLLVSVRPGTAATSTDAVVTPPINTAAPVDPNQCAPCHLDLGSVDKPGIIFNHGNHLMVSCDGCHARLPHRKGVTESVPMEACFACHGVQHGPQGELATSECRKCHTKSFDTLPADHNPKKEFAGKPHADLSKKTGVNRCMMCHTASKDCNPCHVKQNVQMAPLPDAYEPMIANRPKGPSIKMYPTGPTNMAQCVYCHPDLDAIVPGRLIFAHATHLRRDYPCTTCHPKFGHTADGPAKPDMLSCYRCHGLSHQGQGLVATQQCDKCHPKGFKLEPNNHTQAFVQGKHKILAEKDTAYCAMCHASSFCVDCHLGHGTGPNAPTKPVIPLDHTDARWQGKHGSVYLARQGLCGSCHTGPSCQRCHKTVVPHAPDFIANHRPAPGVTADDCNVCHRDRTKCQACHHNKVKDEYLVAKNCVPCHKVMSQTPATDIKDKGMAEHAVHFNVAKKKGHPYKCYECHVDFGSSQNAQATAKQQGHDLRLCYGCHGALDPLNQKIAPYPGASLCRRCHSNLNI